MSKTVAVVCFVTLISVVQSIAGDDDSLVGDRPDATEAAVTVGHLRLQIETGFAWERFNDGNQRLNGYYMPTLFRLGYGDNFEFRLETAAFSKLEEDGSFNSTSLSGFSPVALGFKYNFFEGSKFGDPTVGLLLMTEIPSGTGFFESDDHSTALKFLISWEFNDTFSLGSNLGIANEKNDLGESEYQLMGTASFGIGLSDQFGAFIELVLDSAGDRDTEVIFNGGITYLVNNNLQFDIAAGSSQSGDSSSDLFFTTGVIYRF